MTISTFDKYFKTIVQSVMISYVILETHFYPFVVDFEMH